MFQIELKIGTRRTAVLLALASAISLLPVICNAQTAALQKQEAAAPEELNFPVNKTEASDKDAQRIVGTIEEGYRFKGGDTSQRRNWEKVGGQESGDPWDRPWNKNWDYPFDKPKAGGKNIEAAPPEAIPSVGLFDDLLKPKSGTADALSDAMATKQQNRPVGGASNFVGPVVSWVLLILGLIGYFKMRSVEKKTALESLPTNKLVGIHGWLRFFVISLGILGPALSLGKVGVAFRDAEMVYSVLINSSEWSTYKTTVWLTLAAFLSFSIYAALQLRFVWKPASVTLAKTAVASWPVANLLMGVVIPTMVFPGKSTLDAESVGSFLALIVSTVVWITYLSKSKRVRATYYSSVTGTQPLNDERPDYGSWKRTRAMDSMAPRPGADKAGRARNVETDDRLYEKAATPMPIDESAASIVVPREEFWSGALAEFDSASRRSGLYARAFAEAQGNEAATKANYLRYRAGEMEQEYQLQIAERQREIAQEEAERVRKLEEAQALEAQRIYLSLPKGRCPNFRCKAVIPLASQACPRCGALFEGSLTWSVRPLET